MIPAIGKRDAGQRQVGRPAPGGGPQPADHQDGRGVLQQQRDADRQVRDGVVVAQLRAGDRDHAVGDDGLARAARPRGPSPGLTMVAKTAITSAPPAIRAVTAAVGLQPASISALANGPDMPKRERGGDGEQQAEPEWSTRCRAVVAVIWHLRHVMSKMTVGHDTSRKGGHESNDFQS